MGYTFAVAAYKPRYFQGPERRISLQIEAVWLCHYHYKLVGTYRQNCSSTGKWDADADTWQAPVCIGEIILIQLYFSTKTNNLVKM